MPKIPTHLQLGSRAKNLNGLSFERLKVLGYNGKDTQGRVTWLCKCNCGKVLSVYSSSLLGGLIKSCGCLKRETTREMSYKYGQSNSKEYSIWSGIKRRCLDTKRRHWEAYGGRGITICERWLNFSLFLSDMGKCPPNYTIERKDNDGNYEPDNCLWVSRAVQNRNKRSNHLITFNGETKILTDWANELGINPATLRDRLKNGWTIEKALLTPIRKW